jgi:hypothetical protein
MQSRGYVFGVGEDVTNPTKVIEVVAENWPCDYELSGTANVPGGKVSINNCLLSSATPTATLMNTLVHEFTHAAGLADVTLAKCASGSIMYRYLSPLTDLTDCDRTGLERRINRLDSDLDGWADEDDCQPDDPWVYPGAPIYCDMYDENADRDCNGYPDWGELGCIHDYSPLLVSTSDNPVHLTDAAHGVRFDLDGDGVREQLSWTLPDSDDAWLALDRDGDGKITNGNELFGNFSPQPGGDSPNGFRALTEYDLPEHGGNNDGVVDQHDAVWTHLRLWTDRNHDGVSQSSELRWVGEILTSITLDFRVRARRDQYGNIYKYWSRVAFADGRPGWIVDVYLKKARLESNTGAPAKPLSSRQGVRR